MDGLPPWCKKWWMDRSAMGTATDPVRGPQAEQRVKEYKRIGARVERAPSEQDYLSMRQIM